MTPETPAAARIDPQLERYSRQILFEHFGPDAQRKLLAARATLVGCGALGTVIADTMVRAGLGFLRIVDRDYIEPNNLQRQVLFDEQDIADGLPKAAAAAAKLARINSQVRVEPLVTDANHANIESLLDGCELLLDGTDNFETRFLMNDAAVKHGIPWIYGACISATGMVLPILPGETPCLRCIWPEPPPPGTRPTCDTAAVHVVAALQCVEAIKLLTGRRDAVNRGLIQIDVWTGRFDIFDMQAARDPACPCCGLGRYEFLSARSGGAATLCGRNAVQVSPASAARPDFAVIAARVASVADGPTRQNRFMLRFAVGRYDVTLFADGRAIIKGTPDPQEARSVYAKFIGA
jgi:molybdopterin/thiamine biosynthesis adenylyltransferase